MRAEGRDVFTECSRGFCVRRVEAGKGVLGKPEEQKIGLPVRHDLCERSETTVGEDTVAVATTRDS